MWRTTIFNSRVMVVNGKFPPRMIMRSDLRRYLKLVPSLSSSLSSSLAQSSQTSQSSQTLTQSLSSLPSSSLSPSSSFLSTPLFSVQSLFSFTLFQTRKKVYDEQAIPSILWIGRLLLLSTAAFLCSMYSQKAQFASSAAALSSESVLSSKSQEIWSPEIELLKSELEEISRASESQCNEIAERKKTIVKGEDELFIQKNILEEKKQALSIMRLGLEADIAAFWKQKKMMNITKSVPSFNEANNCNTEAKVLSLNLEVAECLKQLKRSEKEGKDLASAHITANALHRQLQNLIKVYESKIQKEIQNINLVNTQYQETLEKELRDQALTLKKIHEEKCHQKITFLQKEQESTLNNAVNEVIANNAKLITKKVDEEITELLLRNVETQVEGKDELSILKTKFIYDEAELVMSLEDADKETLKQVELEKKKYVDEIREWKANIANLENMIKSKSEHEEKCRQLKRFSDQVDVIKSIIDSKEKVSLLSEWNQLLQFQDYIDEDVIAFISAIPTDILARGVENIQGLQYRFRHVEMAGVRATYLSSNPGFIEHLLAEVFTLLTFKERDLDALRSDNSEQAKLHRAACYLENGNIPASIEQIKNMQNQNVRSICSNWLSEAGDRIKIESYLNILDTFAKTSQNKAEKAMISRAEYFDKRAS